MDKIGYDMSGHRSKSIREFMGQIHSRYAITVCSDADQNCPYGLWSMGTKLHWPFDNPSKFEGDDEEKLAHFRMVRDQIDQKVKSWLTEINSD
jgi:arsenate reductase